MSRRFILVALFAVAACERSGPSPAQTRANASRALRYSVAYPQSSVVTLSTGTEAAEMVLTSPAPIDTIVAWYRLVLPLNKWTIKTNSTDRAGNVTMYAERDKMPLWITLQFLGNPRDGTAVVVVFERDIRHDVCHDLLLDVRQRWQTL